MQLTHTPKQFHLNSKWSGGTTTQLFIYPPEASYAERNFLCRISTATVEVPESDFTPLPDVERILMILDGELTITHEGHYIKHLKSFDTDMFSGNWNTKGKGVVTDFNVMTKGNTKATLQHLKLHKSATETLEINNAIMIVYAYKGKAIVNDVTIDAGDVLITNASHENEMINLQAKTETILIITTISI